MPPRQQPIDADLFSWPGNPPALIGTRCTACNTISFPARTSCPKCCAVDIETLPLETRGRLWTWTTQNFPPKSPPYAGPAQENFLPYAVGYVELPGQVRVETRINVDDFSSLKIGMEMELVIEKFTEDRDGNDLMSFAFRPARPSSPRETS